ncbi:MAG: phosphodiester glycosidase family protein [Akkermansiaceae bacterium]
MMKNVKWNEMLKGRLAVWLGVMVLFVGVYRVVFVPDFSGVGSFEAVRVGHHPDTYYAVTVDPRVDDFRMVWGDGAGGQYGSIGGWKKAVEREGKELVFAMNGGMYEASGAPKGLYVEKGVLLREIDLLEEGKGNFYMQPNGVLFVTEGGETGEAGICRSGEFRHVENVRYATQSGPMLLVDGEFNGHFREGSDSRFVRNGVGLLEDGRLVFAMSKVKVNFYDFARFFKEMGCREALYLDGYVSKMYAPGAGVEELDGDFGVMLGAVR